MRVEALYDHGQIKFNPPIHFATECFPVIIQLPDAEVLAVTNSGAVEAPSATASPVGGHLLEDIREILGPLARRRPAVGVAEDKATLVEVLEEKYGIPKSKLGRD
ncbi:MAG: hypothetical protein WAW42_08010 [Candidatus Competibacteraceae bacterium]|jgi:hypothetical protein